MIVMQSYVHACMHETYTWKHTTVYDSYASFLFFIKDIFYVIG